MYARPVLREDEEAGPIGPSPLEKIRATGDPVDIKSDITKIKSTVSKIQASPAYQVGMGAWSGGLAGAAKAAGTHVPSALSKAWRVSDAARSDHGARDSAPWDWDWIVYERGFGRCDAGNWGRSPWGWGS